MRADRLVATLLLLQARTRVTAAEVAAELEVSQRTARRDLEALAMAGIPVYPQPGRNGGWALLGGARTDLSGLTAAEAQTLFMVAGPAAGATPELKAALRKLVRALPEPLRAGAQAAAKAVVIDPGGWGKLAGAGRPELLDVLQGAVASGRQVRLGYADRTGRSSERTVHPLGLAMKGTVWYLVADTEAGLRTFRVTRVTSVEDTGQPVHRPPDFDLEATWQGIVAEVEELRAPHRVEMLADPGVVSILRWMFGTQLEAAEPSGPGRVPVAIGCRDVEHLARQIAGFGRLVEVVAPVEARTTLARIGRELADIYTAR
jgi:predicted DNA-binding transcriptional regulator YafY